MHNEYKSMVLGVYHTRMIQALANANGISRMVHTMYVGMYVCRGV